MNKTIHRKLYLLTISVITVLLVPNVFRQGLFMDGLQYACVSKNFANGKGSFWFPYISQSWWYYDNWFLEHPPLFYFLESFFFKIFGAVFYTEKLFCLTLAFLNAFIINSIWSITAKKFNFDLKSGWLAILFWIIIPINFWAYQNNAIETLVTTFVLLAILFSLNALFNNKYSVVYLILAGIAIFLATLSKGIPGLFPLSIIPLYFLFFKSQSIYKTSLYFLLVLSIPILIYSCLILFVPAAKESLLFYWKYRLLHRIANPPEGEYRLFTLVGLFQELIPLFVVGIIIYLGKRKSTWSINNNNKVFWFFICVGLSGVLPLMVTLVQKKFYFVPALPLFAIALTSLLSIRIQSFLDKLKENKSTSKFIFVMSLTIIIGTLLFSWLNFGGYCRDELAQREVNSMGKMISNETKVSVESKSFYEDWSLQFYLLRNFDVSIEPLDKPRKYFITTTTIPDTTVWTQIKLPTKKYSLYKLK